AVVSNADPKTTFLKLLDPAELDPSFIQKTRNYRAHGTVGKVHLALTALPKFVGVNGTTELLSGRIHIGPDIDYLERAFDSAKYGDLSPSPYLDITIPSLTDPDLAPAGAHVMSVLVQFAPCQLRDGDWETRREELGDTVIETISAYAPNLKKLILARQVL